MRIDPQEVKKAYEETGLIPAQHEWLNEHKSCACGLGVLAVKASQNENVRTLSGWAKTKYGEIFAMGFTDGFDGVTKFLATPDYLEGYENGKAVWEAVKPKEAAANVNN